MSNYDDIIDLNRPISKYHHLSNDSRAAQFAPFSALTGYEEQVGEVARLTDKRIDISDESREEINRKLCQIGKCIKMSPFVRITYFIPDIKKSGGKYITINKNIKRIDSINEIIVTTDNIKISLKEIIDLDSDILKSYNNDEIYDEIGKIRNNNL